MQVPDRMDQRLEVQRLQDEQVGAIFRVGLILFFVLLMTLIFGILYYNLTLTNNEVRIAEIKKEFERFRKLTPEMILFEQQLAENSKLQKQKNEMKHQEIMYLIQRGYIKSEVELSALISAYNEDNEIMDVTKFAAVINNQPKITIDSAKDNIKLTNGKN